MNRGVSRPLAFERLADIGAVVGELDPCQRRHGVVVLRSASIGEDLGSRAQQGECSASFVVVLHVDHEIFRSPR
jgi:hypothetical protein